MYKNGTGINIDKISETAGDYKQGVEICINNISLASDTILNAIGKLVFFENLVIHTNVQKDRLKYRLSAFNNRKIDKFNNFSTCDFEYNDNGIYAKVGKVLYKVSNYDRHPIFDGYNFVAVECPIGSVNVTPNREQLQYTDKTNKKLKEAFDKSFEEMNQIAKDLASKDFKSIQAAYVFYTSITHLKLAPRISFNARQILKFEDLSINEEKPLPTIWKMINKLEYEDIPDIMLSDIYNKQGRRKTKKWVTYRKLLENEIAIKYDDRLKNVTKSYYCDEISKNLTYVIKNTDIHNLLAQTMRRCRNLNATKTETLKALSFILKNLKYNKLQNDKVPQSYIEEYRSRNKSKTRRTNEIVEIRSYRGRAYNIIDLNTYINYYVYKDISRKKLKNTHMVVYGANMKDDALIRYLEDAFSDKQIKFITMKKEHLPFIPKSKIFISLENFLNLQQKIIAKAATAHYLQEKYELLYKEMGSAPYKQCSFKQEFYSYISKYGIYTPNDDVKKLLQQYIDKGWLDWAAVIKFSLSDEDVKRITQRQIIRNLDDITDSLLYVIKNKYVNDDKFGIIPNKKTTLLLKKLLKL